ncbi:MAG TPA: hypothetical protein VNS79_06665 [Sphingobium sp.]|nr:hypothetical protein [Sphingobium sp.]
MKRSIPMRLAMAGALLLLAGGCATAIAPVDVTRFHGDAVTRQGSVAIVPANKADADSLEFRTTANAVSAALARTGFTVRERGAGALEAVIGIERQVYLPGEQRRSPVSVGVGGSTGSYGSGLGLGIGINLSGKPKSVVATSLQVQLRRSDDSVAIWEGRAETQAKEGTPAAQPGLAAGKLADALFRDFPGPSGVTITVK